MSSDDPPAMPAMTTHDTIKLELTVEDINLILESLGALPFARVYSVIGRIQAQARAQLPASEQEPSE